jgi:hypothetical protein
MTWSPDIDGAAARTCDCAVNTEHGRVDAQTVPVPVGDTHRTTLAAAAGDGDWTSAKVIPAARTRLTALPRVGLADRMWIMSAPYGAINC